MITKGPIPARFLIVGEAPGENEEREGRPFIGVSGHELDRMIFEVGLPMGECHFCNVTDIRPPKNDISEFFLTKTEARRRGLQPFMGRYPTPDLRIGVDNLHRHVEKVGPRLIIALGDTALWALTGQQGIGKWRGSQLEHRGITVIPTWHPAAVLREWPLRATAVHDLRRAARVEREGSAKPAWEFFLRPNLGQALHFLDFCDYQTSFTKRPVICDIETRGGQIACVGLALDKVRACCIPFMSVEKPEGYWDANEEHAVTLRLRQILTNPKARIVFQNGAYDLQYFAKQWGYLPHISDDTMLMQHTLFPGLRKGLDFLASLYCHYYRFWKEDGKLWDPSHMPEDQLWSYNCEDCVRTYEVWEVLNSTIDRMRMRDQYAFQMQVFHAALKMMLRGIPVDLERKRTVARELGEAIQSHEEWMASVLGHPLNARSSKQMKELFYDDFGVRPIINRKTGQPTLNDAALQTIAKRQPLTRPLVEVIEETRSLGVFKSTFAEAQVSPDLRMRCSINLAGAETFRFSASEDAFGFGCNLQTLPKGTEDD